MKSKQKLLVITLLVFVTVQLSCMIAQSPDDLYERVTCQWGGGQWHVTPGEEKPGYCEEKQTPQSGNEPSGNQPAGEGDPAGPDFNPLLCNATGVLRYESKVTKDITNEFGTELCEYEITFSGDQGQGTIWILGYEHTADIWQKTDDAEWVLLNTLEPNEVHTWYGYYTYYHDTDATGPSMLTLEKYAAVINDPECEELQTDNDFLAWIAVELPVDCKK